MSPADHKLERLIRDHFHWDRPGFPALPEDRFIDNLKTVVKAWIDRRLLDLGIENTALALLARVQKVIEEVEDALPANEKPRLFYRFDASHLVKSAAAVLDKMTRDWDPGEDGGPSIGFDDFHARMEDLARFRIVLNFLSDVEEACRRLEAPYVCRPEGLNGLSQAQQALYQDFALNNHRFQNLIALHPEVRNSGERCRKGVFSLRCTPQAKVEVQIQTMLQEAWDKKDHFLVYEPKRRGEEIDLNDRIEIYAMSELLYVADLTFDRLLDDIRRRRGGIA